MPTVDTRIDVGGDEGSLDEECAGATHGVDQRTVSAPSAFQDYAGGQHLIDGGLGLGHTVAALVEQSH